jgi:hypothetical protein
MTDIGLQCHCGQVQGIARDVTSQSGTRLICHCKDCQTFANYLAGDGGILDEFGGTDIYQLAPARLSITRGDEHLRCLRLSPKGLLRCYTGCCRTPVGNAVSAAVPFIGIPRPFMTDDGGLDDATGPVRYYVQGKDAPRERPGQPIHPGFPPRMLARMMLKMLAAKLVGKARPSPLFDATGSPVSKPDIVSQIDGPENF